MPFNEQRFVHISDYYLLFIFTVIQRFIAELGRSVDVRNSQRPLD